MLTGDNLRIAAALSSVCLEDSLPNGPLLRPDDLLENDVAESRRALPARPVVELVEERAWLHGGAGRRDSAHHAARLDDLLERIERDVVAAENLRHVGDLDRIAQVGLVGPIVQHCLRIRNARKGLGDRLAAAELLEHPSQHRLDGGENVLLCDEAHFDVELVELAWATVGARVLVAKAGRDLEIPVEPGDHDELLELLGRLRQRVELARMETRGHQEVASALGAGSGQDRRLELEEPLFLHSSAKRINDLPAQHDVLMQFFAPSDRGTGT